MVGCLDLNDMTIETPEAIAARIRRALPYVAAENVILAPDCGMKYLPRDVAMGKLRAMVAAAEILRVESGAPAGLNSTRYTSRRTAEGAKEAEKANESTSCGGMHRLSLLRTC